MILYSFRRCPYAMRARMALHASGLEYELREVDLKKKPAHMLEVSPKGGVPVLILPDGQVIDESYDIMQWALRRNDPENWLGENESLLLESLPLVEENDTSFKKALDGYKYAMDSDARINFRIKGEEFLKKLEERLVSSRHLLGDTVSIADAAIFPFIRQFAAVDASWFADSPYPALNAWLHEIANSPRFEAVMQKPR